MSTFDEMVSAQRECIEDRANSLCQYIKDGDPLDDNRHRQICKDIEFISDCFEVIKTLTEANDLAKKK